jgi:senataxin
MFAPKPVTASTKPSILGELRVGTSKGMRSGNEDKRIQEFLAKRKAEKAARDAAKAALVESKPKGAANANTVFGDTSDEDSSEDEGGNHLFKLGTTAQRSTKIVHDPKFAPGASAKAPIQIRRPAGPIRRVKDNRARVAPDLTPLYKQILKWEFFHNDAFPPGLSAADYSSVANSFNSYEAYHGTFEPLLLLETWQAFLKSKEEPAPPTMEVNLVTRMRADNFVELETTISKMEERFRWTESDVVLLSVSKTPLTATNQPHCLARVHSIKKKFTGAPLWETQLRCDPPPSMMQIHMRNGATLYALKIMG